MRLVALPANSMHPAIVLAPPLHPPRFQYALRPLPAMNRSMPSVPLPYSAHGQLATTASVLPLHVAETQLKLEKCADSRLLSPVLTLTLTLMF